MFLKPHYKKIRENAETIKQINESKQMDTIQRQLNEKEQYLHSQFYEKVSLTQDQAQSQGFEGTNKGQVNNPQKYSTHQETQTKKIPKFSDYHSGGFRSTQAGSPYNKFWTSEGSFKEDLKSQCEDIGVKKKLVFEKSQIESSPKFNMKREQKYDTLGFTFKKKISSYERLFQQKPDKQDLNKQNIRFQKISFSTPHTQQYSNQNDALKLNQLHQTQSQTLSHIKKKLTYQQIPSLQQNPFIKLINQQIKKDNDTFEQTQSTFEQNRKKQTDLLKKKILQSKSDLKRFYEVDSRNVQYQYRKAKFMDAFLGTKCLGFNVR